MAFTPFSRAPRPLRVVLSTPALLTFVSTWKAGTLAIAQLGIAAFFLAGVLAPTFGGAPWIALAVALLTALVRAVDIESWALLIPGGVVGRVQHAFGGRTTSAAMVAVLLERLLLAALGALVVGHYVAGVVVPLTSRVRYLAGMSDLATLAAAVLVGAVWLRARTGHDPLGSKAGRRMWTGLSLLTLLVVWAMFSLRSGAIQRDVYVMPAAPGWTPWSHVNTALFALLALGYAIPAIGGGDALSRAAHDFAPPRLRALRRIGLAATLFAFLVILGGTVLFALLVPQAEWSRWAELPLIGLAEHVRGPWWIRLVLGMAMATAAFLLLSPTVAVALADAETALQRLSTHTARFKGLAHLHHRFGTPARTIDVTVIATIAAMLAAGGRAVTLAHAYALAVAVLLALKALTLIRLRRTIPQTPYRMSFNIRFGKSELPLGLLFVLVVVSLTSAVMLAAGDPPAIAYVTVFVVLTLGYGSARQIEQERPEEVEPLPPVEMSTAGVTPRPGCVLVPVRNPHALDHVAAALRAAGDREVVVMTVRVHNGEISGTDGAPITRYEQALFQEVVSIAERLGHSVQLLVVPARNVVDAIVATILRLRSSDVFVGESSTLSSEGQARILGDAWDAIDKPEPLDVRLVIVHRTGRTDTYHIGAHPPALTPTDLELIHRLWLDAVRTVGPHVHHHDVVRAALIQMEEQLSGPQRDRALTTLREIARPAGDVADVLRAHDYGRLRDMLWNRDASDVATLLSELSVEHQVVAFRIMPRKDAAAVFEYLSHDDKEALLKAMAQEDVAAILNNMAPGDRTMFLEELPAAATRHLLTLLTPGQRQVARALLGYPESSVGRLMTPSYVSVREEWTVQEVLDYVRVHGRDSETLDVLYVVDEQGMLVDDIRIREILLAPLEKRVSDLMDRRFVRLTATDEQDAAVAVFRQNDRSALPVTDTTGMLIGVVTIDDVLDVAEATATREIQRIGGSEALDEPYMRIAFWSMIQKRAGWLTALFIGEMLTATAMGFFQDEIARAVVLALFVPLIISSGGNSGSQASTLVIRALALGEVTLADWWQVVRRELGAGLTLGAILGVIGFLRITIWSAFSTMYGAHWLLVALTVAISLVGVVVWGTLSGSVLPLILRRLGFDPATSSAPFVATLVDVTGLVIYFSVALVLLHGTLLAPVVAATP
jgi:magnesium transporter